MSKLLINEYPLQVLPTLAKAIGLNEAIFLQQLHYWLTPRPEYKPHYREWEGETLPWIYNTYGKKEGKDGKATGWEANFPFWSARTIMRIVANLRKRNLIITTDEFNRVVTDRTLWYTINYVELEELEKSIMATSTMSDCHSQQDDNMADSREGQNGDLLPETPKETPKEKTEHGNLPFSKDPLASLPLATDGHQAAVDAASGGKAVDPIKEIIKHLRWLCVGRGASMPRGTELTGYRKAARQLLEEKINTEDWRGVCAAIDDWSENPPKADVWQRERTKKPQVALDCIAAHYWDRKNGGPHAPHSPSSKRGKVPSDTLSDEQRAFLAALDAGV